MALSIEAADTPQGRRYAELDGRLCAQVAGLLARLQDRGAVAEGLDAGALGEVVFNNLNQMFLEFARDEAMTLETLHAAGGPRRPGRWRGSWRRGAGA